jgi:hypothetical protein
VMPLRWRARRPSNTAVRRRVHPLRPAGECAAPDTAVPASTRLALLAKGGGCMPAIRFWGAAAHGDWEPRLEALLRTRHTCVTVARPPGQTRPPSISTRRTLHLTPSGPPPRRRAQRANSNALPPFLFPHAARTQARAAARRRRAARAARALERCKPPSSDFSSPFSKVRPTHPRARLGACARAAAYTPLCFAARGLCSRWEPVRSRIRLCVAVQGYRGRSLTTCDQPYPSLAVRAGCSDLASHLAADEDARVVAGAVLSTYCARSWRDSALRHGRDAQPRWRVPCIVFLQQRRSRDGDG